MDLLPIAATTQGGIGRAFMDGHFNPHYRKALAAAKKNGESTWAVVRDKQRWLTRFGAAIAKGNRRLLSMAVRVEGGKRS